MASTLDLWNKASAFPAGKWTFTRMLCLKAPYFSSIAPLFEELKPNYCKISIKKKRSVLNHIGTVHAIAMCNMAELAGGTMTEVTVPPSHRWIPKGMTVEYLKKAETNLIAIASPVEENYDWDKAGEYLVNVDVFDTANEKVFHAKITMWISKKKK
ncbi:hotdog fold domain-containing protein [Acinetobacter haemolyticus]|uniref:hotdog fold domain-containing protein n=1 Tax=Acinetobacter haemolyticus TaxID=29430 RepID=UPI000DE8D424|nr:hotdog fold domain-containing protein [Acinetobacter haemolyticus]WHR58447.1 hotdog fold domain-containing protein [Acinetobacter haemolyticus]